MSDQSWFAFNISPSLLSIALACVIGLCCCSPSSRQACHLYLAYTSCLAGQFTPCGCCGGQSGGAVRLFSALCAARASHSSTTYSERDTPAQVVMLDLGNHVSLTDAASTIYSQGIARLFRACDFRCIGLGTAEIAGGAEALAEWLSATNLPYCACNVKPLPGVSESSARIIRRSVQPYRVISLCNGLRLGVVHALCSARSAAAAPPGLLIADPVASVLDTIEKHRRQADIWVVTLADCTDLGLGEITRSAEKLKIVALIGAGRRLPADPTMASGLQIPLVLAAPAGQGREFLCQELYLAGSGQLTAASVQYQTLNRDAPLAEAVRQIADAVQAQLCELEVALAKAAPAAETTGAFYCGSSSCKPCHAEIVAKLANSAHAKAYQTLEREGQAQSAFCLPCHVTGHDRPGGWCVLSNQPEMQGVQCEACHGPGSAHIAAAESCSLANAELPSSPADGLSLIVPDEAVCRRCHTKEQSSNFSYSDYWQAIAH